MLNAVAWISCHFGLEDFLSRQSFIIPREEKTLCNRSCYLLVAIKRLGKGGGEESVLNPAGTSSALQGRTTLNVSCISLTQLALHKRS